MFMFMPLLQYPHLHSSFAHPRTRIHTYILDSTHASMKEKKENVFINRTPQMTLLTAVILLAACSTLLRLQIERF